MSRALRDLHFLFEDASHIALSSPAAAPCREVRSSSRPTALARGPKSVCLQFAGSVSSLGVVQRPPLRRHTLRASTPGGSCLRARAASLTPFGQDLPPPDSFRPCRSTRLRRFAPLERRGLVASRSRPWGSLRFFPDMQVQSMFPARSLQPSTRPLLTRPRIPRSVRPRCPHHGSPFEGFPFISAVLRLCSGRHRKMLHDNTSARAFVGSPPRAFAQASLRFRLTGLLALAFRREPFDLSPRSSGAENRPPK